MIAIGERAPPGGFSGNSSKLVALVEDFGVGQFELEDPGVDMVWCR